MTQILKSIEGKRTYICVSLIFFTLIGAWLRWWPLPQELLTALFGAGLFFLRAGIKANEFGPDTIQLLQTIVATVKPDAGAQIGALETPAALPGVPPVAAPPAVIVPPTSSSGFARIELLVVLFVGLLVFGLSGCFAPLAPGADPLVVRCEQTEAASISAFETFLKIDDANRAFWKTNATDMHQFAEYLREPVYYAKGVDLDNTLTVPLPTKTIPRKLPRNIAYVMAVDDIKQDYKAKRCSSNDVVVVLYTVESAVSKANGFVIQSASKAAFKAQ